MTCPQLRLQLFAALASVVAGAAAAECGPVRFEETPYTVCTFSVSETDLRLFHSDSQGRLYGQFETLAEALAREGLELRFAMNGGMYHPDRTPVGLHIEAGEVHAPISLAAGPGNFHLLPNGVFWIDGDLAGVSESGDFAQSGSAAEYATQSGPMLVIAGEIHPGFGADSVSRFRRNGVGVSRDGTQVAFAISEVPVNFHRFARLFRDHLETPNALYLDGNVSKLHAPSLDRSEAGLDMGPIVAAVAPLSASARQEKEMQ